jgi:hypothetical protein
MKRIEPAGDRPDAIPNRSTQSIGRVELLDAALHYAELGYRVFPCIPGSKKPYTTHGFHDASLDEGLIRAWWKQWPQALIATPDTCTVDIEAPKPSKNGGPDGPNGWLAWEQLTVEYGAPEAPATKTGLYSGIRGAQLHFADEDVKTGGFADGIELRARGAYVLLPPSPHPTGVRYEGDLPPIQELPKLPDWIADLRGRRRGKRQTREPEPAEKLPTIIRDGEWHRTMVSAAGTMRRRGFSEGAAVAALIAENAKYVGTPPPDSDEEIAELVADVYERYEPQGELDLKPGERDDIRLADLLSLVRLYLDVTKREEGFIIGALATAVSKVLIEEEPLWLILVGASRGGKTEAIKLLAGVAEGRVDELTRAGLLSWASGKKAKPVGLLTRIPSSSLVTISDFSTVVTMGDREARARMFGMLRVVYDGRVYRSIGGQPAAEGDELVWEGHLALIAAGTPVVDTHTSFEGALGERWLMLRLAESDTKRARERARFAIRRGDVSAVREEAQAAARGLVLVARERIPPRLSKSSEERLVNVATLLRSRAPGSSTKGRGSTASLRAFRHPRSRHGSPANSPGSHAARSPSGSRSVRRSGSQSRRRSTACLSPVCVPCARSPTMRSATRPLRTCVGRSAERTGTWRNGSSTRSRRLGLLSSRAWRSTGLNRTRGACTSRTGGSTQT